MLSIRSVCSPMVPGCFSVSDAHARTNTGTRCALISALSAAKKPTSSASTAHSKLPGKFTTERGSDGTEQFRCSRCHRTYKYLSTLGTHQRFECNQEPRFACPHCPYRAKQKGNLTRHVLLLHNRPLSDR
ncbi:hypothetical protein J6590_014736 [Homalodisca vitripennis]|nr:hypothetical protein J6590_014736 [Homalodisca vitripennis]